MTKKKKEKAHKESLLGRNIIKDDDHVSAFT